MDNNPICRSREIEYLRTAISPSAWIVKNMTAPVNRYASKREAGPPVARAEPELIKRPVPVIVSKS